MTIQLGEATREEIAAAAPEALAVLTISATEQHGDHLPLYTDFRIGSEITERVCAELANDFPVFACPVMPYGNSHHHFPHPTLSLRSETLIAVLKDLVDSLVRSGFRRIFILNAHGGNDEAIRITARDMARELGVSIGAASYWTPAFDGLKALMENQKSGITRMPGHAGDFETSVMLAIDPEHVRLDRRPAPRDDTPVTAVKELKNRVFVQRPGNSVGLGGISDDVRHAETRIGAEALAVIVTEVAQAMRDFYHG